MQRIFLIISLFIVSVFHGQDKDLMTYLKKYETNKEQYIGKPLSVLLADMGKVQPTTVYSSGGRYLHWVAWSFFGFSSDLNIRMTIAWSRKTVSREKANYYRMKNNKNFTKEEREFYSDKIIEDISVYDRRYLK